MKITKEIARQIAQEECAKRNWPWREPTYVRWGFFYYTVWGGGRKGGNLHMQISKKDGSIRSAGISSL
jgi:hypothetical protein